MSFFKSDAQTDALHSRARLHIMVLLSSVAEADFVGIRAQTGLADGQLSQQLAKLSDLGLVEVTRCLVGKKSRTTARLTTAGSNALAAYMQEIRQLLNRVPGDFSD
jgi:DNA-binding MarR family transcriptional regulator